MRLIIFFSLLALTQIVSATDYDINKPFGFCTRSSRTDATCTFEVTGGGCYTYPIPKTFKGKVVVLKSNGQDMRQTIEDAIQQHDVVVLDGSNGEFFVSRNVNVSVSGKTLLGINNACIRTQWHVTDEIKCTQHEYQRWWRYAAQWPEG